MAQQFWKFQFLSTCIDHVCKLIHVRVCVDCDLFLILLLTLNSFTTDWVMQFWNKLIGKNTDLSSEKYSFDTSSSSVDTSSSSVDNFSSSIDTSSSSIDIFSSNIDIFSSSFDTSSCRIDSSQVLFVVTFHPEKTWRAFLSSFFVLLPLSGQVQPIPNNLG